MSDDIKKELGKLKMHAQNIANQIHDIVEDSYFLDYNRLPELSEKAVEACRHYIAFKNKNNL